MNNASCCSHADKNVEKPSCCNNMNTSSCCSEKSMTSDGVIDPVCGMNVHPVEATLHVEHEGETYYFCNTACNDSFVSDPEKYLDKIN